MRARLQTRHAADALEAPVFQDPQQLGLQGWIQIADLIEEKRAVADQLEATLSPLLILPTGQGGRFDPVEERDGSHHLRRRPQRAE
jgi:hypothetical protein